MDFDELMKQPVDMIQVYANCIGHEREWLLIELKEKHKKEDGFTDEEIYDIVNDLLESKKYYGIVPNNCFEFSAPRQKKELDKKTYLMIDENTGFYKIGYSNDPFFREGALLSKKPTIKLLFHCDAFIENQLHEKYKSKRMRGEWFNLTDPDVLNIKRIMKKHEGFTLINKYQS